MIGRYLERLDRVETARFVGRVRRVAGAAAECEGLRLPVGAVCEIVRSDGEPLRAEVAGVRDDVVVLVPLGDVAGVRAGDRVVSVAGAPLIPAGHEVLGRVIDAEGRPLDEGPPIDASVRMPVAAAAPPVMERVRAGAALVTGVRAIDGLLTCARGQRVGIFSGSGVGKTTLLGMIARGTAADAVVLALVGERGREVRDFAARDLGVALGRTVVVAETADRPAARRVRAAFAATAIAEALRDEGAHVLLLVDSLSRVASAQREVGLAAGEPPVARGFPPSAWSMLQRLVERAGAVRQGSITAFYTVHAEADDPNDPVVDASRSVLDGHVWLSRRLAQRGQFPAIDVLASVSRLTRDVMDAAHAAAAERVRALLAAHESAADLIAVGAYAKGSDPEVDRAVLVRPAIEEFLRQRVDESAAWEGTRRAVVDLAGRGAE